ncbi:GNAT family N-acetyltransferase [Alkalihalobacillus sp. CinArs1]|uniref:GNAT family N-acetyltransferase n=1 Tax=Alkalihalobacillus sp. CinArs1 TaxID=2995314 RepID=UPI0022DD403E|nr:GNAT family N-acetyltransferase [Alkalihalobacillus sp. CinArs1]
MKTHFTKIEQPTTLLVDMYNRWENDRSLVPLIRPNKNIKELETRRKITMIDLTERLNHLHIYLIYYNDVLVGEMNYMVDPNHLLKKVRKTAWIGITIGEDEARGHGVGYEAMNFLEEEIKKAGLKRIELGVFEFNTRAQQLYKRLGYKEFGRLDDFTYWDGRMWADIRMEKYV